MREQKYIVVVTDPAQLQQYLGEVQIRGSEGIGERSIHNAGIPSIDALFDRTVTPVLRGQEVHQRSIEEKGKAIIQEARPIYDFISEQFKDAAETLKKIDGKSAGWFYFGDSDGTAHTTDVNGYYYVIRLQYHGTSSRPTSGYGVKKSLSIQFGGTGKVDKYDKREGIYSLPHIDWATCREEEVSEHLRRIERARDSLYNARFRFSYKRTPADSSEWKKEMDLAWMRTQAQRGITLSHIALYLFEELNREKDDTGDVDAFFSAKSKPNISPGGAGIAQMLPGTIPEGAVVIMLQPGQELTPEIARQLGVSGVQKLLGGK